jgi:hypothetical protein
MKKVIRYVVLLGAVLVPGIAFAAGACPCGPVCPCVDCPCPDCPHG